MRPLPCVAVLLLAVLPAARAAPEDRWVEVRGAGFTVVSDGSEKEARAVLAQFAQVRALMKRAWPWARLDPSRPVVVLAVRDEDGLRALLPEYWEKKGASQPAGVFVGAPDRNWVALRMDVARRRLAEDAWNNPYHLAFHEYVHLVIRLNFDRLPAWLNEGLAEYWGSTIVQDERVYEGRFIDYHVATLRGSTLLPLERLLSVPYGGFSERNQSTILYAQSWALVHYLVAGADQRKGQLNRYAQLLSAGKPEPEARLEAFGDLAALDRELNSYVRRYAFRSWRANVALDAAVGAATARPLPDAESLGLRAAFHVASGRPREAAALAARALAADPSCAAAHEALALAAWRDARTADAIAALEKAVAAPGASDFAYFLHGQLTWSDSKGERAPLDRVVASLRLAVEKNPGYAEAHEALALALDATGAPLGETLPLAVKASRLEPSEMRYRITALRLSAHGGGAEDARKAARQMLPSTQGEDRRQLEQLLAEISDPTRLPPEAACADGHLPSCQELGKRFAQGAGVAKDEARAVFLFQKTCNGGLAEGCESLGYALEKGAGAPADMASARRYYRMACDAGQLWSCTRLGIALAQAEGGPADPAAAREVLEKPCAAGEPDACAPLGSLLRRGEGGPRDLARAESLLRTACDKGSGWGCGELGTLVAGRGTPSALKDAALLYEKACDAGTHGACAFLAQLLELGRGVPRDLERARTLYRSACDGGYAAACGKAGAQAAVSK